MKITETARTYAFELTVKQYKKVMKRDEAVLSSRSRNSGTLCGRLLGIEGVSEVVHEAMIGPIIFVRIDEPELCDFILEKAKDEIAKYIR